MAANVTPFVGALPQVPARDVFNVAQPVPVEIRIRLVSATLIIVVVALAVLAYWLSVSHLSINQQTAELLKDDKTREAALAQLSTFATTVAGLFGALATFLGTALGAYFGISAASSSVRTLSSAVQNSADQVKQLAGTSATLQAEKAQLQSAHDAQRHAIDVAHKTLDALTAPNQPVDPEKLKAVQTVLKAG